MKRILVTGGTTFVSKYVAKYFQSNNYDVYVLKDYCFSMNGKETYENAIGILKRNIGKDRVIWL